MTADDIADLSMERPHLVILGAGASRAAFPRGDATGKLVPLMNELAGLPGVDTLLRSAGFQVQDSNFEELYAELAQNENQADTAKRTESLLHSYFSALGLPEGPCLYDRLLLSLRRKDVIATFNWDPFLSDACRRNAHFGDLPHVLFLHGSVRAGVCEQCQRSGLLGEACRMCGEPLMPTPLLFPIKDKDYTRHRFIAGQWHNLKLALSDAYILTIFGYAAPVSDEGAVRMLLEAWSARNRPVEQVEIINIAPRDQLVKSWSKFFTRDHLDIHTDFAESWCARFPRRSCEACWGQFMEMRPRQECAFPSGAGFPELEQWLRPLVNAERGRAGSSS